MFGYGPEGDDDGYSVPDPKTVKRLGGLRRFCNAADPGALAIALEVPVSRIEALWESDLSNKTRLEKILKLEDHLFADALALAANRQQEKERQAFDARAGRDRLIQQLKRMRGQFAGVGTNRAKRRLNKLAVTDPFARAVRIAIEAEDKNITAKTSFGKYQNRIYGQKSGHISALCALCRDQGWAFGVGPSDVPPATHVVYFDLPGCEQLSWHYTPAAADGELPRYAGAWDGKHGSTLLKLESVAARLLGCAAG